jgi:hypothetical protein
MKTLCRPLSALAVLIMGGTATASALTQTPTAAPPYSLAVFATAPAGLSAPDSIAVLGDHVFVGYGDGHAPDGSDGLSSQVVEYDMRGNALHTFTVKGHNDGLKVDPLTQLLWALQKRRRQFQSGDHRPCNPWTEDVPLQFRAAWRRI